MTRSSDERDRARGRTAVLICAVALLALTGCTSGDRTSLTEAPVASTEVSVASTEAPAATVPTSTVALIEVPDLVGKTIDYAEGALDAKGLLIFVDRSSDAADYVHLHVYDVSMAVHPGVPAILRMVAAIPGVFEAEMHGSGLRVFESRVP